MKYLLPVILALVVVHSADAQQRFFNGSCGPVYYQSPPVYHQPTYTPTYEVVREVIVPVFTPLAVYVDPRISYHYNGLNALPLSPLGAQQQFGGQLGGFGAPFGQQQPLAQPAIPPALAPAANGDETIDALIDRIEKRVRQRQRTGAFEPPGPPIVPNFTPPREFVPKVSMLSVLGTHCAECHTGPRSKGSFVIFDVPGRLAAGFNSRKAWEAVRDGLMPPRERPRMSEDAKLELKKGSER